MTPFTESFVTKAVQGALRAGQVVPDHVPMAKAKPSPKLNVVPFDDSEPLEAMTFAEVPEDAAPAAENWLSKHIVRVSADHIPSKATSFLVGGGSKGMFPTGHVGLMGGAGGAGKSAVAISLAVHVAAGLPFCGMQTQSGCVLLVSLEDDADEMQRRILATVDTIYGAGQAPAELFDRIRIVNLSGSGVMFTQRAQYGAVSRTLLADEVADAAAELERDTGTPMSLIVVDHARLAMAGDPNESEAVSVFMATLTGLAKKTGAAVVLLCHTPKSSRHVVKSDEFGAWDILGSGGFPDNSRYVVLVTPMVADEAKGYALSPALAESYVALRVVKSNYSRSGLKYFAQKRVPAGWDVMVPIPVEVNSVAPPRPVSRMSLADKLVAAVASNPGKWTQRRVRDMAGVDGRFGVSEKPLRMALAEALDDGRLTLRPPTDAELSGSALRKSDQVLDLGQGSKGGE